MVDNNVHVWRYVSWLQFHYHVKYLSIANLLTNYSDLEQIYTTAIVHKAALC